jgi:hypothetical protein
MSSMNQFGLPPQTLLEHIQRVSMVFYNRN